MAKKITDLTTLTEIAETDITSIVDVSDTTQAATGTTKKTTLVASFLSTGWIPANGTWTYASATTITVPSGAASKYQKGDKIRLKQGGAYKYYYIITVADTLLTVTGGIDYTVANAAITDNYYSHIENPLGFPDWLNWTPTITVDGGTAPTYTYAFVNAFKLTGRTCYILGGWGNNTGGTAGAGFGILRFTLPVTITVSSIFYAVIGYPSIGSGYVYEEGEAMNTVALRFTNYNQCYFENYGMVAIIGNNQSVASRYIAFNGFYPL